MVAPASAHSTILLSVDVQHVVAVPGQSVNVTLTVENNASAIESYNISVDESTLASVWSVHLTDATVDNVFPTWTKNTTLVVRLAEGATVADSGSFTVSVTSPTTGTPRRSPCWFRSHPHTIHRSALTVHRWCPSGQVGAPTSRSRRTTSAR